MKAIIGYCSVVSFALVGVACADVGEDVTPESTATSEAELQAAPLPYGVPVPEGRAIKAPPEPYTPAKHGAPLPNSAPASRNLADDPAIPHDFAKRHKAAGPGQPLPPPGDGDRGFFINSTGGTGIYVGNDVQDNVSIPYSASTDQVLYAPTHQSPGGSCVETVTVHWRPAAGSTTYHAHGMWDWCRASPGWGNYETMDATWKSKYARSYSYGGQAAENMYFTSAYKTSGNCWAGTIYNFTTGTWETKLTSCGTTKTGFGSTGWTMWESWYLQGCPSLPRIKAGWIQTLKSSGWTNLGSADTSQLGPYAGTCYATGAYTFFVINANYAWEGRTP